MPYAIFENDRSLFERAGLLAEAEADANGDGGQGELSAVAVLCDAIQQLGLGNSLRVKHFGSEVTQTLPSANGSADAAVLGNDTAMHALWSSLLGGQAAHDIQQDRLAQVAAGANRLTGTNRLGQLYPLDTGRRAGEAMTLVEAKASSLPPFPASRTSLLTLLRTAARVGSALLVRPGQDSTRTRIALSRSNR